jgi:hypothetical protein
MDDFPAFAKIGDGAARNANPPRAARIIFFIFSSLRGNDIITEKERPTSGRAPE